LAEGRSALAGVARRPDSVAEMTDTLTRIGVAVALHDPRTGRQFAYFPPMRARAPRAQPRPRSREGRARCIRSRRPRATRAGPDDDPGGEPEPARGSPPNHLRRFVRSTGLEPSQFRWCRRCGIVAVAIDAFQRDQLDAVGFTELCPDCEDGAL
jgi:hypothetical protein